VGVFFIAGSFLGAGLFLAPVIGGRDSDPPLQVAGANFLYVCLLIIVVGSVAGELAAVHQFFDSLFMSQWFGHQGYEYIDLGRFWQCFLMVGLLLWLVLMVNAVWPACVPKTRDEEGNAIWHLTLLLTISCALIGLFYLSGFLYSARTHLTMMEYWRWWVVHIWVEGLFEIFTTLIIAFVFVKLGVFRAESAVRVCLASIAIFMLGGIPGMFHHNYWNGTTTGVMATGACFSALEVVPLSLMGHEVAHYVALTADAEKPGHWLKKYTPLVNFFTSVAFWNFFGAGVLGFAVNPPISLYYTQFTYLVQAHAHSALWGVYGVLAMALNLLVLRLEDLKAKWDESTFHRGLQLMNVGMFLMCVLSMIPIGLYQFQAAMTHGYWFARSEQFHWDPVVLKLKLARAIGDIFFLVGQVMIAYVVFKLATADRCVVTEKCEPLVPVVTEKCESVSVVTEK